MVVYEQPNRRIGLLLLCALLLLGLKAAFLWYTPVRSLVMTPWLIDDSFIVARIARNVALGKGFSFDGIHPTTGVSFLWTYLTSLSHLLSSRDLAVKTTLMLSTLFGTLSTLVTFAVADKVTGNRRVAWLAFALASLLPVPFFNAMNGMETSFFTLMILLSVGMLLDVGRPVKCPDVAWGFLTGLFAGLAFLTRADAMFFIMALGIVYLMRLRKPFEQNRKEVFLEMIGAALALALCAAVVLGWQYLLTGEWTPANQVGRRAIALSKHHFDFAQFQLLPYLKIVIWNVFELEKLVTLGVVSTALAVAALLWSGGQAHPRRQLSYVTGIYLTLFALALVAYQWYFPDFHGLRYLNPVIHLFAIFLADLLIALLAERRWGLPLLSIFGLIMTLSWYQYFDYARRPQWAKGMNLFAQVTEADEKQFWAGIDWMATRLPAGTGVAVRDHGRIAFFTDKPIQDLAGILDPEILNQRKNKTLATYLKDRNVTYLVLPPAKEGDDTIYQDLHESLKLKLVTDAPSVDMHDWFHLYQIQGK